MPEDLLSQILMVLKFGSDERKQVLDSFNTLIKSQVIHKLIADLPAHLLQEIRDNNLTLDEHQAEVSKILHSFYKTETINDYTEKSFKENLVQYLEFILNQASEEERASISALLQQHGVKY